MLWWIFSLSGCFDGSIELSTGSLDIASILTPSAISILDCISVLVIEQGYHLKSGCLLLVTRSLQPLGDKSSVPSPANKTQKKTHKTPPPLLSLNSYLLYERILMGFRIIVACSFYHTYCRTYGQHLLAVSIRRQQLDDLAIFRRYGVELVCFGVSVFYITTFRYFQDLVDDNVDPPPFILFLSPVRFPLLPYFPFFVRGVSCIFYEFLVPFFCGCLLFTGFCSFFSHPPPPMHSTPSPMCKKTMYARVADARCHATRRTPHGASLLVPAKSRRAPFQHGVHRVCDRTTAAVHDIEYTVSVLQQREAFRPGCTSTRKKKS